MNIFVSKQRFFLNDVYAQKLLIRYRELLEFAKKDASSLLEGTAEAIKSNGNLNTVCQTQAQTLHDLIQSYCEALSVQNEDSSASDRNEEPYRLCLRRLRELSQTLQELEVSANVKLRQLRPEPDTNSDGAVASASDGNPPQDLANDEQNTTIVSTELNGDSESHSETPPTNSAAEVVIEETEVSVNVSMSTDDVVAEPLNLRTFNAFLDASQTELKDVLKTCRLMADACIMQAKRSLEIDEQIANLRRYCEGVFHVDDNNEELLLSSLPFLRYHGCKVKICSLQERIMKQRHDISLMELRGCVVPDIVKESLKALEERCTGIHPVDKAS